MKLLVAVVLVAYLVNSNLAAAIDGGVRNLIHVNVAAARRKLMEYQIYQGRHDVLVPQNRFKLGVTFQLE